MAASEWGPSTQAVLWPTLTRIYDKIGRVFKSNSSAEKTLWRRISPRTIFLSALVLLIFSAVATGWTIYRLYISQRWVEHTYHVQIVLDDVEADMAKAGRSRSFFVTTNNPKFLSDFDSASKGATADLAQVRNLMSDNQEQQVRCDRLESVLQERLAVSQKSIELAKSGVVDASVQDRLATDIANWVVQGAALVDEINNSEKILLSQRRATADKFFRFTVVALAVGLILAIYLIWEHYRRLERELQDRTVEEQKSRRLSIQLLQAQDAERRRIARELHDGLGQTLSAAKILADTFLVQNPGEPVVTDISSILEESIEEARTMSYLLHPPLLDEIGLASAAEWLVEGFSKRTGINVDFAVGGERRRLSQATELTLFRVLQESLTNIHRHARASAAEVRLTFDNNHVALRVHDHGIGIPPEKLADLEGNSSHVGLGLMGMKNRVEEQKGDFRVSSDSSGSTVEVELPAT